MTTAIAILTGGLLVLAVVLLARYLDAASWRHHLVAIELHLPFGLAVTDIERWHSPLDQSLQRLVASQGLGGVADGDMRCSGSS